MLVYSDLFGVSLPMRKDFKLDVRFRGDLVVCKYMGERHRSYCLLW